MARKRMVDPNIWQSEDFGKLSTLSKLVFIGLFSLADDEGRGRANAMYLKSSLFPYNENLRSIDIEKTLSEISSNMSVVFYECNGNSYYSLLSWYEFQKIDKPTTSKLPAFDENNKDIQLLFADYSPKTSRGLPPNRKEENRIEKEKNRIEVKRIYNETCTKLPQVQKLNDKRNKSIDEFLKTFTLEEFRQICITANNSNFLSGGNDRNWKADFDFLMRTDKAVNILEGKYGDCKNSAEEEFLNG